MRIRVNAPDEDLTQSDIDAIHQDLEKLDRRLQDYKQEVTAEVRIRTEGSAATHYVVVELDYGRNHLMAKAENKDMGIAVREAREELLRQINDRSRGGHSSFAKRSAGRTP
jgi:ribosome-associated translation inhibitor RaiA